MRGRTCTLYELTSATGMDEPADVAHFITELAAAERTMIDLGAIPTWVADEVHSIVQPGRERTEPQLFGQTGEDV